MEMKGLEEAVEEMKRTEVSYKDLFRTVARRKSLTISLGLMVLQQVSGISVVMFHSSAVFQSTGSALTPTSSAIVLGINRGYPNFYFSRGQSWKKVITVCLERGNGCLFLCCWILVCLLRLYFLLHLC
jgi:hypothetical protein